MINIIDADFGNIHSVIRAFKHIGKDVKVVRDLNSVTSKDTLVLPGVGSFGVAIEKMHQNQIYNPLIKLIGEGLPFVGICIGLQLLFDESEESPGVKGLGVIPGKVKAFVPSKQYPSPQIGWNDISIKNNSLTGFNKQFFYFVHSYYAQPESPSVILAEAEYGRKYTAAVQKDNIIATQFHLEKSGRVGLGLLNRILEIMEKER